MEGGSFMAQYRSTIQSNLDKIKCHLKEAQRIQNERLAAAGNLKPASFVSFGVPETPPAGSSNAASRDSITSVSIT